jgi:polyphosphate kinase
MSPARSGKKKNRQALFLNREWSWLRFNERVFEEAEDPANPLLERIKFLAITASNLDEFFMIRVAGLYRQLEAGIGKSGVDDRTPEEQIRGIARMVHAQQPRTEGLLSRLFQELAVQGIRLRDTRELEPARLAFVQRYYDEVVYPVLTPMIVGPTHPFPMLQNGTLYLVLRLARLKAKGAAKPRLALVGLSRVLPRFVSLKRGEHVDLIPIESLITTQLPKLFAGYAVHSISAVRVTRDADIVLDEEAAEDLRRTIAKKLLGRRHGAAVRMEHGARMEAEVGEILQANLDVDRLQHYPQAGLMQLCDLMQVYDQVDRPDLKYRRMTPLLSRRAEGGNGRLRAGSIFDWVRRKPQLFYHPYHSFDPIAELVAEAAEGPSVLAIKQTLYRTSGNSPVVRGLTRAAENGKQVTAVVELRARCDEERNLEWAHRLEQAGAHVVYGLLGLKTHCKALLVVRREKEGIRRYVHFGTGNYNDATARVYTDLGLLACDDALGEDASALFNVITGATLPPVWNRVEMSPTGLRRRLLHLIEREIDTSAARSRGRIVAKMNSLVDREMIEALYEASRAGVKVELIVRGICCLRPGVRGTSENITVRSIVGRFLEHARIFYFRNGGKEEFYLSSADWMPRNLDHRLELMFPVEDPQQRRYLMELLELQLRDNVKARELLPDGSYRRVQAGKKKPQSSQDAMYDITRRSLAREDQPDGEPQSLGRPLRSRGEAMSDDAAHR